MRPQPNRPYSSRGSSGSGAALPPWVVAVGAALVLCLGVGLVAWGWHAASAPALRVAPFRLLVACDISGSVTADEKRAGLGVLEATYSRALPQDSRLTFWAFGNQVWDLYDGRPLTVRELWPLLDRVQVSTAAKPGSSQTDVLERMRAIAAAAKGEEVAIMLLADGEDLKPENTERVVRELAALPNVAAVWMVGVPVAPGRGSDIRGRVARTFRALGERFIVSGPYDVQDGLKRFGSAIEAGRAQPAGH